MRLSMRRMFANDSNVPINAVACQWQRLCRIVDNLYVNRIHRNCFHVRHAHTHGYWRVRFVNVCTNICALLWCSDNFRCDFETDSLTVDVQIALVCLQDWLKVWYTFIFKGLVLLSSVIWVCLFFTKLFYQLFKCYNFSGKMGFTF